MWKNFWLDRQLLDTQYDRASWPTTFSADDFNLTAENLTKTLEAKGVPKPLAKAELISWTLDNAPVCADPNDFFQDHIRHSFTVQKLQKRWINEVAKGEITSLWNEAQKANTLGAYTASYDFSHTTPDWNDVLSLGFPGLLSRVREYRERHIASGTLNEEKTIFYNASETVYLAVLRYVNRLEAACVEAASSERNVCRRERLLFCAQNLKAIAAHGPQTIYEALQTTYLYFILQDEIESIRLRSLGGLDRLYERFYRADLQSGRFTRENIKTLFQYFFQKFHALIGDNSIGQPFYLGGGLPDGTCAVSVLTDLIIEAYDELNTVNPKIQIRVSKNTPRSFVEMICDCIRRGNSAFVFINDECAIPMMQQCGATLEEAREYVPIGCYEPGIMGKEVACTLNGGLNMPKTVELVLHNGVDPLSGEKIGIETGDPETFKTFDALLNAVKSQQRYLISRGTTIITEVEKQYMQMNPSPLFSATMVECVEQGKDAYAGGAKYNNSSFLAYGNGTVADELAAIHKLVYLNKGMTLPELVSILDANWDGHENLRLRMLRDEDKWGNNRDLPDSICVELSRDFAGTVNSLPNGRSGRFKAAMYSINHNIGFGAKTGASADGRKKGEPISRNMGASSAMDRNGVTSLIKSVTKLDHQVFPSGSVLDFMLHPSVVEGTEGLKAFSSLIETYMNLGGYAIHGNVFSTETLKEAQVHPEQYENLQVRLCGWSVYWKNLSKEEQDVFILKAETADVQ